MPTFARSSPDHGPAAMTTRSARSVRRSVVTVAASSPASIATHRSGVESSAPAAVASAFSARIAASASTVPASAWNKPRSSVWTASSGKCRRTSDVSSSSNGASPARIAAASASSFASGPRSTCPVSSSSVTSLRCLKAMPAFERRPGEPHVALVVVREPDGPRRAGGRRRGMAAPPGHPHDAVASMRQRSGRREPRDPEADDDHIGTLCRHLAVVSHAYSGRQTRHGCEPHVVRTRLRG